MFRQEATKVVPVTLKKLEEMCSLSEEPRLKELVPDELTAEDEFVEALNAVRYFAATAMAAVH